MRQSFILALCVAGTVALTGCQKPNGEGEVEDAMRDLNVIDETDLNDIMLTVSDPNEAVIHFRRTSAANPERVDLKRGLALSLIRSGAFEESVPVWRAVADSDEGTHSDRVDLADALLRSGEWDAAEAELNKIPPTFETYKRYRLEAIVADSHENWDRADSFYEIAAGLTTRPAGVLNNWGYSLLTRGSLSQAERMFVRALNADPNLFTAKNNLVLARSAQRNYTLPVVQTTQIERATLLHTAALTAVRQGDINIARGLLQQAIDTHPQHFEAAVSALNALDNSENI
ncbi:tetratricopeptide repeat protein [Cochlodiniinecator piscidefendens]|uniref:tetratricopeptide repeat protein n=1 Tax=Cochlodiniinecator piscidefendens TaxID=2715756 RepID=UPI00140A86F6|nr:tetratricopeptide repeat protein [Cochlodiniinecator piscidefendens]